VETTPQIAVPALRTALQGGAAPLVLDVRDADEWAAGHIAGAIHIPFQQLQGRLAELPRDRPLAVICAGGNRSSIAASLLQRAGFAPVENVRDGMDAWQEAGLPISRNGATYES
jgi:rhodanese-related sulfurtransferase